MNTPLVGHTLEVAGTLIIGYVALRVHRRVALDRKIDAEVVEDMNREQRVGVVGLIFVLAGYLIQIVF